LIVVIKSNSKILMDLTIFKIVKLNLFNVVGVMSSNKNFKKLKIS